VTVNDRAQDEVEGAAISRSEPPRLEITPDVIDSLERAGAPDELIEFARKHLAAAPRRERDSD
jgi:hypothetical protein